MYHVSVTPEFASSQLLRDVHCYDVGSLGSRFRFFLRVSRRSSGARPRNAGDGSRRPVDPAARRFGGWVEVAARWGCDLVPLLVRPDQEGEVDIGAHRELNFELREADVAITRHVKPVVVPAVPRVRSWKFSTAPIPPPPRRSAG